MEINLILTANTWQLASQLERTKAFGGVLLVKNVPERTYLAITPTQWQVLARFSESHTVPQVLEGIINDRVCPALGEFYELILKAVRARILVAPDQSVAPVPAANWALSLRPAKLRTALWILFAVGFGFTAALRPDLPASAADVLISLGALAVAVAAGAALSASLLRGAGGEVYVQRGWMIRLNDVCMLPPADQRTVLLGTMAVFSAVTGFLTWHRPAAALLPLVGLLLLLRPILGGRVSRMIRVGADVRLSDAEHAYLFPPNRTPRARWRLLRAGIRNATTWLEIGYGALWTLVLGYFVGVLTDVPPWKVEFWKTQGPLLATAIIGSLVLLAIGYIASEAYLFARDRAVARHETLRLWYRRWFGGKKLPTEEPARLRAVLRSPLLRMLPPPVQRSIAKAFRPEAVGPWKILHDDNAPVTLMSQILSGRVGIYRKLPTGRRVLVQILCEDDIVGLHAVADPERDLFVYRTLTPVVLLRLDWPQVEELVLARLGASTIANQVQKLPFLSRISLCQNWHQQAIQRFAELSRLTNYTDGEVILQNGFFSESFYIIFEGEARIMSKGKLRGVIRGSDFFGEIGLLQNSNATAQVLAGVGTRCLCIMRREFLRFVAHNYTVALELERVSSLRLGHPVFPLSVGDFKTH